MSAKKVKNPGYESLAPASKKAGGGGSSNGGDRAPLKPAASSLKTKANDSYGLINPKRAFNRKDSTASGEPKPPQSAAAQIQTVLPEAGISNAKTEDSPASAKAPSYADLQKQIRREKVNEKDRKLLSGEKWLARNGHALTYLGIFLFTLIVYFRPYELIPALSGFTSMALVAALVTVLIYLPTQLSTEGTLTILSTEVKCILFVSFYALLTIPIAKSPTDAWTTLNDYSKIVLIFIIMVNTLRSQSRLKGLMWLAISVGVLYSFQAIVDFQEGATKTEEYRVNVKSDGMFGNPNDLALHLAMFVPVAVALGIAAKNKIIKIVYFAAAAIMIGGNIITLSRGGFLGLIAAAGVLAWKIGKKQRVQVVAVSAAAGLLALLFAPGNYGMRLLSIFNPALDASGSSDQRGELLKQSILVTLRNPWGIGMGNFPVVGIHNLHTHNAYTQISSELGLLTLLVYLIFLISPLRKLGAIERQMFADEDASWMYYLSIGVQASIIAYMVSSFFLPVAYNWYLYYPIAYAVCLRRMYRISQTGSETATTKGKGLSDYFKLQKA